MPHRLTALTSLLIVITLVIAAFCYALLPQLRVRSSAQPNNNLSPSERHEVQEKSPSFSTTASPPSEGPNLNAPNTVLDRNNIEQVSLSEISKITTEHEATVLFQRLSVELIHELHELEAATDSDKIISRLTPLVQNFYYLKRQNKSNGPQQRLPQTFQADIKGLEQLWNDNITLAQTADSLFARFDLLQFEHVPYQLRAELTLL